LINSNKIILKFKLHKLTGNWRPGGAIKRKYRILDGKEDEWSDMIFKAPRW
jgi:hypothetical protein